MPNQLGSYPTFFPSPLTGTASRHETPFPTSLRLRDPILDFAMALHEVLVRNGRDISSLLTAQMRPITGGGGSAVLAFRSIDGGNTSLEKVRRMWADGNVSTAYQNIPTSDEAISLRHTLQSFFKMDDIGLGTLPYGLGDMANMDYASEMNMIGRQRFEASWRLPLLYTFISTLMNGLYITRSNAGVTTDVLSGGQSGQYNVKGSTYGIVAHGSKTSGPKSNSSGNSTVDPANPIKVIKGAAGAFRELRAAENRIVEGSVTDSGPVQVLFLIPQTDAEFLRGQAQEVFKSSPDFKFPEVARNLLGLNGLSTTIWNERFSQVVFPLAAFGGYGYGSGNAVVMTCPDAVLETVLAVDTEPNVQKLQNMRFTDGAVATKWTRKAKTVRYVGFALQDIVVGVDVRFGYTPPQQGVTMADEGILGRQDTVLRVSHTTALLKNNVEVGEMTVTPLTSTT